MESVVKAKQTEAAVSQIAGGELGGGEQVGGVERPLSQHGDFHPFLSSGGKEKARCKQAGGRQKKGDQGEQQPFPIDAGGKKNGQKGEKADQKIQFHMKGDRQQQGSDDQGEELVARI